MIGKKERYLYTQDEVAEYLGLTHATVYKIIKNGEIKGIQIGNGEQRKHRAFSVSELDEYRIKRITKKCGNSGEKEMLDASLVVTLYRRLKKDARHWALSQMTNSRKKTNRRIEQ